MWPFRVSGGEANAGAGEERHYAARLQHQRAGGAGRSSRPPADAPVLEGKSDDLLMLTS